MKHIQLTFTAILFLSFFFIFKTSAQATCGTFINSSGQCIGLSGSYEICANNALLCCTTQVECTLGPIEVPPSATGVCGEEYSDPNVVCPSQCAKTSYATFSGTAYCCGLDTLNVAGDRCIIPVVPTATPTRPVNAQQVSPIPDTSVPPEDQTSQVVTSDFLSRVNPLTITGDNFVGQLFGGLNEARFATPAAILNRLLRSFLFPLAGIILFIMILWGGFEMLYGANDSKAQEAGKQRITAALIGFLLLFVSYWIAQIVQTIFGVNILGG